MDVNSPTLHDDLESPSLQNSTRGLITFASSLPFLLLQHLEDSRICQVWSSQLMEVNPAED
jgi:hypothetical protein